MPTPEIFPDMEQGSPEWYEIRRGLPTASVYADIIANGKNGEPSKMRRTLLYKLAGELITGDAMENYSNAHMERGKAMEDEARQFYAFTEDVVPQKVGFIKSGITGCSPDSLVGDDGMLEIKTAQPHILIPMILKGEFPEEHKPQCQGNLMCAGPKRKWIDLIVYWPKMPKFVIRAYRDGDYIKMLDKAVRGFDADLKALVKKLKPNG